MVTIYDIARRANCSAMTVSKVINNTGRISEATRKRVLAIMEEMNYIPNSMARSLVLQETRILSLLITDITNPFYTSLARGAEDAALRHGYKLLLANSDEDMAKEKAYIETIMATRVDGVLYSPTGDESATLIERLTQLDIPVVLVDREVPGVTCDMVLGDSRAGARSMVEHLIEYGHRRIALVNGPLHVSTSRLRLEGYKDALQAHGIPYDPSLIVEAGYQQAQTSTTAARLLELDDRPTAVFAANNFFALGTIRTFQQQGLRVPEDISVCCFDELEAGFVVDPFMTVMAQPAYEFGTIAVDLLVERIRDKQADKRTIMLQPVLHSRRSVKRLI